MPRSIYQLAKWDEDGPGFIGEYLDEVSNLAAESQIIVERRGASGWEGCTNDVVNSLMSHYTNNREDTRSLIARHFRLLSLFGECFLYNNKTSNDFPKGWCVLSPLEYERHVKPDYTKYDIIGVPIQDEHKVYKAWRSWRPHPHFADMSYSDFTRLTKEISMYSSQMSSMHRNIVSKSRAGILYLGENYDDETIQVDTNGEGSREVSKVAYEYHMSLSAYNDSRWDDSVQATVPYIVGGDEPKFIKVNNAIDEWDVRGAEFLLQNIARGLKMPTKLLVEGAGESKFWNEALLDKNFLRTAVRPIMNILCADLTKVFLHPAIAKLSSPDEVLLPSSFRLSYDIGAIERPVEEAGLLLEAERQGIISKNYVAKKLWSDSL